MRNRIPGTKMAVPDGTEPYPMTKYPEEFNVAVRGLLA
jgi:hypothetical protein